METSQAFGKWRRSQQERLKSALPREFNYCGNISGINKGVVVEEPQRFSVFLRTLC